MLRDSLTVRFPPLPMPPWDPAAFLVCISASVAVLLLVGIAAFALPRLLWLAAPRSRCCSPSAVSTCGHHAYRSLSAAAMICGYWGKYYDVACQRNAVGIRTRGGKLGMVCPASGRVWTDLMPLANAPIQKWV